MAEPVHGFPPFIVTQTSANKSVRTPATVIMNWSQSGAVPPAAVHVSAKSTVSSSILQLVTQVRISCEVAHPTRLVGIVPPALVQAAKSPAVRSAAAEHGSMPLSVTQRSVSAWVGRFKASHVVMTPRLELPPTLLVADDVVSVLVALSISVVVAAEVVGPAVIDAEELSEV